MKNKLAIIIPAYKACFFREVLDSIVRQSNRDFTVYIGDDASPDDLESIVSDYKDKLDIFYIPIGYEEIFSATNETLTDDIARVRLTLDDLGYPFDKDLFMIFTNGTKINYEMINNINNHTIDVDIKKMKDIDDNYIYDASNTCVLKFIQESELLGKIFSYSDHWSNAVDSLTNEQYLKLLETTTKK